MKKYLLSFILSVAGFCMASADAPLAPEALAEEPVKGLITTYEGSEVCYKLDIVPTIKYETIEGVQHVLLYLEGIEEPVLDIALDDGNQFVVTFGEYLPSDPTAIESVATDKVTITEQGGKKVFRGGKLIIIGKDGKMYNAAGVEINK